MLASSIRRAFILLFSLGRLYNNSKIAVSRDAAGEIKGSAEALPL
jgi:hypothetical protein